MEPASALYKYSVQLLEVEGRRRRRKRRRKKEGRRRISLRRICEGGNSSAQYCCIRVTGVGKGAGRM